MRKLAPLFGLSLAGCVFGGGGGHVQAPPPRPMGSPPVALNLPTSRDTQACFADLSRQEVRYSPLPDRDFGGGCQVIGAVQLIDIGVPVSGVTAMRCGLAEEFIGWMRNAVAPAAYQILGSRLVRVETMGSYACRNTVGTATLRLSGHATANAVDVSAFVLADGRRISVRQDWHDADDATRRFFTIIHGSACKRFGTVLSPDYNAAHHDHLHLEDDHKGFCR
ncbi:MAG: extensin family protein [Sphingomonas sp.]|uniref:extensin family protein n=1 Tax=Sphingomonas sp. TaxID=28214 RepID=UPI001AD452A2|nr:extensin family protein [Sphingomonas sp.]MBN8809597.1 extensin family protein [Sphingomonas sp.]